jgi:hypothetical protein
LLAFVFAADARPQPGGPEVKDGKLVLKLTVSPAATPEPSLRYTFLPTIRQRHPGNQIPAFYKCFMEQNHLFFHKDAIEQREKWLTAPLADLKGEKDLVGYGGLAVRQAGRAARLAIVDWQILDDLRTDGISLLLPDLHQLRELSRVLRARARGEIARGEFPAAIETIQTQLALGRTMNDHPTMIGTLVGISITAMALASVEELIAQPGAPNLFWAFADLPSPLFDLRTAAHGERLFMSVELDPVIDRVNPMSEAQIGRAVMKITELIDMVTLQFALAPATGKVELPPARPVPKTPATYLGERAADPKQVAQARAKLMPTPPVRDERVKNFPALQVVLIDELNKYEAARDDNLRWMTQPASQLPDDLDKVTRQGVFGPFVPGVVRVINTRWRVQQQLGMLQVVEGVRAFAAANGNRLPGTLDEVRLPLPADPFTGKPYRYEVANGVATIRGATPPTGKADPLLNRVYEVAIRP